MKRIGFLTVAGAVALLSTSALAASVTIKDLPDEGTVMLKGVVKSVENEREFTLQDETGSINVDIASGQSVVLKAGDQVAITGTVDKDITGTDIKASHVDVRKGFVEGMSDATKAVPGVSTTDAQAYTIGSLPKDGLVKVTGLVTEVDNEQEFTLKDDTGSIAVDVKSSEKAALTEGAKVTVIGLIDSGLMTKHLQAHRVFVVADARTAE